MKTKAEIIAKQQEVYTLNPDITDWDEVEETLHTEPESILETIYESSYSEDSTGTHTITTPNANFNYIATINKVGRTVFITGSLIALDTVGMGEKILEIDSGVTGAVGNGLSFGVATNSNTGEAIEIRMNDSNLETNATILVGERFRFNINYRTLN